MLFMQGIRVNVNPMFLYSLSSKYIKMLQQYFWKTLQGYFSVFCGL